MSNQETLLEIYKRLLEYFGHRNWWPGETTWEIMVGAILTQNVSWSNVEKAINNLKETGLLELEAIYRAPEAEIAQLIRPTRYYNMKAKKLKALAGYLMDKYGGDLESFFDKPLEGLREELLAIWGIGPETADSILLYAGGKATFVVDAYTKRIFHRLGIFPIQVSYEEMRGFFMKHLPSDVALFNDYHAQIVALGHHICQNKPCCSECPLESLGKCTKLINGHKEQRIIK